MRSVLIICLLILAACVLAAQMWFMSAPSRTEVRPASREDRQYLRACAPRSTLLRKDLDEIALRYKVIRGERPDIDAMLEANKGCRVGVLEQLDFSPALCASQKPDELCPNGVLLVPIR